MYFISPFLTILCLWCDGKTFYRRLFVIGELFSIAYKSKANKRLTNRTGREERWGGGKGREGKHNLFRFLRLEHSSVSGWSFYNVTRNPPSPPPSLYLSVIFFICVVPHQPVNLNDKKKCTLLWVTNYIRKHQLSCCFTTIFVAF